VEEFNSEYRNDVGSFPPKPVLAQKKPECFGKVAYQPFYLWLNVLFYF